MNMDNSTDTMFEPYANEAFADIVVYTYYYQRVIFAAVLCTISVFGTVGNSLTIAAVALTKELQTTTNVFVVNLAMADVLTCLFIPWQAVAALGEDGWPLKDARWLCVMAVFLLIITMGCSINNLALIAANRWVGITKSRFTASGIYTRRKVAAMVGSSWCVPLCLGIIPLLTSFGELGYEKHFSSCSWDLTNSYAFNYNILVITINFPVQAIVIVLSYTSIFRYVRKTSRSMARFDTKSIQARQNRSSRVTRMMLRKRQLDVTKNLMYTVLAFILCLTPFCYLIYVHAVWSYPLLPWAAVIMYCNSCVNPAIYATSHPDFKRAFRHIARCKKIPLRNCTL